MNKLHKVFMLLLILGFSITSCSEGKNKETNNFSLKKSEVVISHGDLLLNNRSHLRKITGQDSLLSLSLDAQQFVIFDLKTKRPVYSIDIALDGPDFFDVQPKDLEVRDERLYVLSKNYFSVYTLEGEIIARFDANDFKGMNTDYFIDEFELINLDLVLFNKASFEAVGGVNRSESPQNIFMTLDMKSKTINELNIYPPKEALVDVPEKGYYNDFSDHEMIYSNDSIIYSFRFSSKTYVYDMANGKTTVLDTKSNLTANLRESVGRDALKSGQKYGDYTFSGPKFSRWSKDDKSGYYARIHYELRPLPDGGLDKYKSLMLLNPKLEVVAEFEIDDRVWEPAIFINGKIYAQKVDQTIEDGFEYMVYELEMD